MKPALELGRPDAGSDASSRIVARGGRNAVGESSALVRSVLLHGLLAFRDTAHRCGCGRMWVRRSGLAVCVTSVVIVLVATSACAPAFREERPPVSVPLPRVPAGLGSLIPIPAADPLTHAKVSLGRQLFFDRRLSKDGSISCASCHQPERAYSDGRPRAAGVHGRVGRRNTPTLVNVAYSKALLWDGRSASLEAQASLPLFCFSEMDQAPARLSRELGRDPDYRAAFGLAFGEPGVDLRRISRALAAFQRTLVAGNSPYDEFVNAPARVQLPEAAWRGFNLFRDKARCGLCHEGPLFTDQRFHNTGVGWGLEPPDRGLFEVTADQRDSGRFRTPTLRQLVYTAPYMHDGSLWTLRGVVEFYNRGGNANPNLDPMIRPLALSASEQEDLVAFLVALSNETPAAGWPGPP